MGFMTRKKHADRYRPTAWHEQKMPAQTQNVVASEPAPVVASAPKKKSAKKRRKR